VVAVEAVGGGQRELVAVAIEQVERRDAGLERVPCAVTTVSRSSSQVRAVVATRRISWRNRSWATGSSLAGTANGAAGLPSSVDIGITAQA
jgi:hypothetical protein